MSNEAKLPSVVVATTGGRGGIRAVVEGYARDGVFTRWNARILTSHVEGTHVTRVGLALRAMSQLAGMLARGSVALLHCHAAAKGSFVRKSLLAEMARRAGVPVILHLHGSETRDFVLRQGPRRRALIRRQLELADAVVVLSQSWRDFVVEVAPRARAVVVPNYVVMPERTPRTASPVVRVVFLGLLGRRKGIFDLLAAVDSARQRVPALRLFIGGNGDHEGVTREIERRGLGSHVQYLGWVSGPEKADLLRSADLYVLPSYNEGLPMSLLEAMSFGVPVVSTRVGGIPELVRDRHNGRLIDAGDVASLASALVDLGLDPLERESMGEAARRTVEETYSRDRVLPRLESLYRELIARRPSAARPDGRSL